MIQQDTERYEYAKLVAQVRFSLIAPIVSGTYTDYSITAYFERISQHEVEWPDDSKRKFSAATLKEWLHNYRKYGIDGITPKPRLDAGMVRKLTENHKEYINQLLIEFPKITGVIVYETMINKGLITQNDVSVDTVQRYIKKSSIRNGTVTLLKERRSWEYARSCDSYEADTCHTFYIFDEKGDYHKIYLIAMIDIHSRMIAELNSFIMIMP